VTHPPDFGRLKAGESVALEGGGVVRPSDVLGPPTRGRAFAYVTDTRPCDGGLALAERADLVYHEATFAQEHAGLAHDRHHSTARQAASVAEQSGASRLILSHFSARYREEDLPRLRQEAREVFPQAELAEELTTLTL
jgi:ribonuclease Z